MQQRAAIGRQSHSQSQALAADLQASPTWSIRALLAIQVAAAAFTRCCRLRSGQQSRRLSPVCATQLLLGFQAVRLYLRHPAIMIALLLHSSH
jgi:hypothetical protein